MNLYKFKYHGVVLGGAKKNVRAENGLRMYCKHAFMAKTPYQAAWKIRELLARYMEKDVDDIRLQHHHDDWYHYYLPEIDRQTGKPTEFPYYHQIILMDWQEFINPAKTVNEVRRDIIVADQMLNSFKERFTHKDLRFTEAQIEVHGLDTERTIVESLARLQLAGFVKYDERKYCWINKGFKESV